VAIESWLIPTEKGISKEESTQEQKNMKTHPAMKNEERWHCERNYTKTFRN